MRGQDPRDVGGAGSPGHLVEEQRDRHKHAPREGADGRHEDRAPLQPGIGDDLGDVFVGEAQGVELETWRGARFVVRDHGFAAAAVAGDRVDGDRHGRRDDLGVDERTQQGDRARRVAARVGDEARGADRLGLARREFRKAVGPSRRHAMRGRGVEHARAVRHGGDQGDRLARGVVREAEDDDVDLGEQRLLRGDVLAVRAA